jgi:hypothetical protein
MKYRRGIPCSGVLTVALLYACSLFGQRAVSVQDTLPDNYLVFALDILDDRLEGGCEHLEGFVVTLNVPEEFIKNGFDYDELLALVRNQETVGTLTYPNGKTTPIRYEIVDHRGTDDVYMKTTLGYFLWESVEIKNDELLFVIYWWYCPPARKVDLEIIEMTMQLLADSGNWRKGDDRKCGNDLESDKWSLFCALKYASMEKTGEYNHHNTAMQTVRFVIDDMMPDHGFAHTLMDYNNAPSVTHRDLLMVLDLAGARIKRELKKNE